MALGFHLRGGGLVPSRRGGIGAETAAAEEERRSGRRSGRIRRGACGERREEAGDIKWRGRGGARRRSGGVDGAADPRQIGRAHV